MFQKLADKLVNIGKVINLIDNIFWPESTYLTR